MRALLALLITASIAGTSNASADTVPEHLVLARQLAENIKPENNRYSLGDKFISYPGDRFSDKYAMKADCSGFVIALFERAKYSTPSQMTFLDWTPNRRKYKAEDFVLSIEQEKGFRRIKNVEDIRPGDILAHAMLNESDKKETGTTGHVRIINSLPISISSKKPIVDGTRQFEVSVIDSSEEHDGADDTRIADASNKVKGLGKVTIRLYADANGELVGWARTFGNSNRFFSYTPRFPSDTKLRKAAVGRPIAADQR
jgi:hypothetical protein